MNRQILQFSEEIDPPHKWLPITNYFLTTKINPTKLGSKEYLLSNEVSRANLKVHKEC